MKKLILTSVLFLLATQNSFARNGANDQPGSGDDGRMIVCTNLDSGATILQFMSTQLQGQVATPDLELLVKARGDDVGEMSIKDLRSGDAIRAKALEELLKVTLTTGEGTAPTVVGTSTHRGQGQLQVIDAVTQGKVTVSSLSRRGVSEMELHFVSNENPGMPVNLKCMKAR